MKKALKSVTLPFAAVTFLIFVAIVIANALGVISTGHYIEMHSNSNDNDDWILF